MTTIRLLLRMRCEFDCMSLALCALLIVVVLPHTYRNFTIVYKNILANIHIHNNLKIDCLYFTSFAPFVSKNFI